MTKWSSVSEHAHLRSGVCKLVWLKLRQMNRSYLVASIESPVSGVLLNWLCGSYIGRFVAFILDVSSPLTSCQTFLPFPSSDWLSSNAGVTAQNEHI